MKKKLHQKLYVLVSILFAFSFTADAQNNWYVDDASNTGDRWTPNSSPGNDANSGSAMAPFATINKAMSVASPGDNIYVDAGTYTEYIDITKSLNFYGSNKDISPVSPLASPTNSRMYKEAIIISPALAGTNDESVITFSAHTSGTTIVINGFKIEASRPLTDAHYQRDVANPQNIIIQFTRNWISNGSSNLFCGSNTRWKTISINDNYFDNITRTSTSSAIQLNDASGLPATVIAVITNNRIDVTNFAGILLDNIANATVTENFIRNTPGEAGIQLAGGMGTATVSYNTIQNANTGTVGQADGGAIRIYGSQFTGTVNIGHNLITASKNGFAVKTGQPTITNPNIHVNKNSLDVVVGSYAIYHGGSQGTLTTGGIVTPQSGSLDAECNWYGSNVDATVRTKIYPTPPSTAGGIVDYTPFLNLGGPNTATGNGFNTAEVCNSSIPSQRDWYVDDAFNTDDRWTRGSLPGNDANSGSAMDPFATMTRAIIAASPGDNIYVDAGTYTENVIVTKSLKFYGANKDISPVSPAPAPSRTYAEAIVHAPAAATPSVFDVFTAGTSVEINGFKLMDGRPLRDANVTRSGATTNDVIVLFKKNWVQNGDNLFCGTLTTWKDVTITDNFFDAINKTTLSSAIQLNDAGTPTATVAAVITNNRIDVTNFAGILLDNIANATVTENFIRNTPGEAGIQLAGGMGTATVSYNTIQNANTGTVGQADGGAIRIYGSQFTGTVNIGHNLITASKNGFAVKTGQMITNRNIHVNKNSFGANVVPYAIYHGGTETHAASGSVSGEANKLDAECNYYGSDNATSADVALRINNSLVVDYTPWLQSGSSNIAPPGNGFNTNEPCSSSIPIAPPAFRVTVLSNPATNNFFIQVESQSNDPVKVNVVDLSGRLVAVYSNVTANSTFKFGNNLKAGVYYAQIIQGTNRKIVKLVKVN